MCESQKQHRSGTAPIKNPLLSASVTGLTIDDFPNKPLLLPAAPPIVHAPVPASVVTPSGQVVREPKSLVTVGYPSLDTENLDEINLNAPNEEIQTSDAIEPNPLLELSNQGVNSDSILSQAASSFSALPSVASNVFSTFSKRITSISSRETTPIYDQYQQDANANTVVPQLDTPPTYIQQQGNSPQAPSSFFVPPLGGNFISSTSATSNQQDTQPHLPSAEPPKFYTPADVPPVPSTNVAPPTNLGGQNNFRFSSKKKLYAPVPGLSDQSQKPITTIDPSTVSGPISYGSSHGGNTLSNYYLQPQYSTPEQQNPGSGLFSKISNLAPVGVLQNITGLVQSATGSLTQTNKTDCYQQAPPLTLDQQNNFFTAPAHPTNYFVSPTLDGQQKNTASSSTTANFFTPQTITQDISATTTPTSHTQIPLHISPNLTTQIDPSPSVQSSPQLVRPKSPQSNFTSTPLSPNQKEVTTLLNPNQSIQTEPALNTAAQVAFFDPAKYLPPSSQTNIIVQSNLTPHSLPPQTNYTIPPPASGHTSYRLQKGTKLYTNLLIPKETTSVQVTPNQIQDIKKHSSQQGFTTPQGVASFAAPTVGEQSAPLIALPAPFGAEPLPISSAQSAPLFVPSVDELKSNETLQSIPLFHPSYNPIQSNSLLAPQVKELKTEEQTSVLCGPPIKKLKSEESQQNVPEFTATIENKNLNELETNATENSASVKTKTPLESIENIVVPDVKNSDIIDNKEIQTIFEPIEPVFEENISEIKKETIIEDPLEKTLEKLTLTEPLSETKTDTLPPIAETFNLNNPYRKGPATGAAKPIPILANFFTPEPSNSSADFNFFATLPTAQSSGSKEINFFSESVQNKEIIEENSEPIETLHAESTNYFTPPIPSELTPLEPHTAVQSPISAFFPTLPPSLGLVPAVLQDTSDISKHFSESLAQENVPPPIGFESFTPLEPTVATTNNTAVHQTNTTVKLETTSQTEQTEIENRFSNYFNQAKQQPEIAKDPLTFFDSLPANHLTQPQLQQQVEATAPSIVTNEEQRIQYFFNNPPPKDANAVGDLNYDLVHSGLGIKNLQQRSLTPISNLVEPPSSACSEFSEISNSTAGQKSIAANLSVNERSEKEESIKSAVNEQDSSIRVSNIKTYEELPEEILKELRMANLLSADKTATKPIDSVSYKPVVKHWFFKHTIGDKHTWVPFSHYDSALLETSLLMEGEDKPNIVAVEGGRYDVNISERKKVSVYWDSPPIEVRRCSWFYKAVDSKYVPYEERTAEVLENEYKQAAESGVWHKTIVLGMGEQVVFHGPTVIVHFQKQQNADAWGGTTQTATRPRVVKRDLDDFNIEQGESQKVDHLLFMVHGIGSACDLKLRSVEEVDDFRTIARQLVQSHYKNSSDLGLVGRVEVLPISWHNHLHSVEMGIDEKLRLITLESIPKLRHFTNDTLLDILFYTSPTFCQKIMNTIVSSMNTLYSKYRERNPEFNGGVSLAGHSLGSLILFDLLCHQNPIKESEERSFQNPDAFLTPAHNMNMQMDSNQLEDKQISYTMGPAGTGQPFINYSQLIFEPKKFFALGSPIGMFVTIRGIDKLGLDFRLPTCPGFYNIFHPYDPVAYRIEALVNPDLSGVRPVLIPHHKGRKRMHLELKETMTRVTMDLKSRFLDKFKTTLDSVNIFGSTSKSAKEAEEFMEKEVDKVIQMQMQLEQQNQNKHSNDNLPTVSDSQNETVAITRQRTDSSSTAMSDDVVEIDFPLGKLNDSKRIDYVLQEAPLEFINEYIFALSSHVCYWDSEDTILFVMKEIYSGLGISPDSQVPQQTMTIERPSSRNSS